MTRYVVDASVAIKWYVPEVYGDRAVDLLASVSGGTATCHVPDLFHSEFGNILWKKVRAKELAHADAQEIIGAVKAVPKIVHDTEPILSTALSFACETDRTVYDSIYVTLAAGLDCQLVTADERLWNALKSTQWRTFLRWIEAV